MKAATAATSGASRCAANTLCPPGGAGAGAGTGAGGGDPTSLEARVAAFKADPALMEVATRFVAEVLERAKEEASKRLREKDALQELPTNDVARGSARIRSLRGRSARWGARAQNFLVRIFASLCLCNTTSTSGASSSGGGGVTTADARDAKGS